MKIAFLVNNFPKISETFILNQITELIDRGHEVEIFARRRPDEDQVHSDVHEYNLISKAYYPNVPSNKVHRLLQAGPLFVTNVLRNPQRVIESLRFRKYGRDALSLRMLYYATTFTDSNFDILFCHFGLNGNLGALLSQTGTDAPVVTMFHGFDVRRGLESESPLYNPAFSHSDVLLANSETTKKKIIELGANPEKVICHPVGIDVSAFPYHPSFDDKKETDPIVITTVARLAEIKGHEYSIRAIAEVIRRNPNRKLEYRIVGGGSQRESLEDLVQELGIEDSVRFLGQVNYKAVQHQLRESDIFLLSSLDEGLGMVLLEAQATGLPIVATEVGGIPQAVDQGKSAFLVSPKDPTSLADRIEGLCENPELCEEMGMHGREYVSEKFDIYDLASDLEDIFYTLS